MIKLTAHAEERVQRGEIAASWIELTVLQPDWTRPDPRRSGITLSFRAMREFGGRVLRVAHRPLDADVLVITAFFDRVAQP